jgi:hypothetical protein
VNCGSWHFTLKKRWMQRFFGACSHWSISQCHSVYLQLNHMFVFFILFSIWPDIKNFSLIQYLMCYMALFARILYTQLLATFSKMHSCISTADDYSYFSWIHFTSTLRPFALLWLVHIYLMRACVWSLECNKCTCLQFCHWKNVILKYVLFSLNIKPCYWTILFLHTVTQLCFVCETWYCYSAWAW